MRALVARMPRIRRILAAIARIAHPRCSLPRTDGAALVSSMGAGLVRSMLYGGMR